MIRNVIWSSDKNGKNIPEKVKIYFRNDFIFWFVCTGSQKSPRSKRQRTTSMSKSSKKTSSESILRSHTRTIYTAGRPPWYNSAGQQVEPFVIGKSPSLPFVIERWSIMTFWFLCQPRNKVILEKVIIIIIKKKVDISHVTFLLFFSQNL